MEEHLRSCVEKIQKWSIKDHGVVLNTQRLEAAMRDDLNANGQRPMTDDECREIVVGDHTGVVPSYLTVTYPRTDRALDRMINARVFSEE